MPGATPLRESACRVSKTDGFLRYFFWSGAPLSGNPAVECQKLMVFCDFFLVGCTPLRENEGRVSKTDGFLRFWGSRKCPENCAHDSFCLIRPFFRERKNEQKLPKNVKNWGVFGNFFVFKATLCGNPAVECQKPRVFCDFFLVGCTPLRENEGRVSKTGGFLRFWGSRNCPENCAHDSFCLIRPFFNPFPR